MSIRVKLAAVRGKSPSAANPGQGGGGLWLLDIGLTKIGSAGFEELNGLLFYPVQYEGEEMSPNVFYTGAAPNQQAIPAVEYLLSEDGGGAKRFFLLGTDYVYPRTTNKILRAFLHAKGSG